MILHPPFHSVVSIRFGRGHKLPRDQWAACDLGQ